MRYGTGVPKGAYSFTMLLRFFCCSHCHPTLETDHRSIWRRCFMAVIGMICLPYTRCSTILSRERLARSRFQLLSTKRFECCYTTVPTFAESRSTDSRYIRWRCYHIPAWCAGSRRSPWYPYYARKRKGDQHLPFSGPCVFF